jgi:hypothetical protein
VDLGGAKTFCHPRQDFSNILLYNLLENLRFESMLVMRKLLTPTQSQQLFEKLHSFSNMPNNQEPSDNPTLQVIRY